MPSGTPDFDAIVIGSGPNGLVAACVLARAGLRVRVFEAHPLRAGGAVGTEETTLPGFLHDVGAAFFPWGTLSPAFRELQLERHGLIWHRAEFESCHPAPDGTYAAISADHERSAQHFGTARDGAAWERHVRDYAAMEPALLSALLEPFPTLRRLGRLISPSGLRLATIFASSGRGLAERWFESVAARRVLPGLALHVDVGPDDVFGAALGYMLAMTASSGGFVVPRGGAQAITRALIGVLQEHGGDVRLGSPVERVLVRDHRAGGVVLRSGEEFTARLVMADTDVAALLLRMVDRNEVPPRVTEFLARYPRGWGTFKMDWALSGPVPWSCEVARRTAVVHLGDSLDDLSAFTRQVRRGELPSNPYLVVGQQSLLDPTRAPTGSHALWAYSRVPPQMPGGWREHASAFADRVEARIEALAPGFRQCIAARHIVTPEGLEAMDANLVGGDLGGGSNAWHRQLLFRPLFPYFRYRTPVRSLYLCSSYAHPGAGVHGMCGFNAARIALQHLES